MGEQRISNTKLAVWTLISTLLNVFVTSSISFYFQQKNLRDEKLINYRSDLVKEYTGTIDQANVLIKRLEVNIGKLTDKKISLRSYNSNLEEKELLSETMNSLNKLGELGFKLPYQMRNVVFKASTHYGTLFWNLNLPEFETKVKLATENLTADSFAIAFKIATENYILDGELRHKELSGLLK